MLEKRNQPLIALPFFIRRVVRNVLTGIGIIIISLFGGMVGYHHYEKMNWVDAYVNAAMILSGMGPVTNLVTDAGKIFAGSYALFSGIIFLVVIAIILIPLVHRFFHGFLVKDKID